MGRVIKIRSRTRKEDVGKVGKLLLHQSWNSWYQGVPEWRNRKLVILRRALLEAIG